MDWREFSLVPGVELRYQVEATLFSGRTSYQQVDIVRTSAFGTALFLDGDPQSAELDEYVYHEALVHPALLTHPEPRRVLVVGGGEGATLREVLRHKTVERAVMVDIDGELVDLCRRYLPSWHQGAFEDPRAEVRYEDAFAYLAHAEERFDVVVIDLTAPLEPGPSRSLYGRDFYRSARSRLADGGVLSLQAQSGALNNLDWHIRIIRMLRESFPIVRPYRAHIPFFTEPWAFAVASTGGDPLELDPSEIDGRLAARGCAELQFYDGSGHQGLFSVPAPIRRLLKPTGPLPATDGRS